MIEYIARRVLALIPTLLALGAMIFLMIALVPGDPARIRLGERARPEAVEALRKEMGLDQPLAVQLARYFGRLFRGDLGTSIKTNMPVATEIAERLPATVELAFMAMMFALTGGILLGVLAAAKHGRWQDALGMALSVGGVSMPIFWLGIVLILIFSFYLPQALMGLQAHWSWVPVWQLPAGGRLPATENFPFITRFFLLESLLRGEFRVFWQSLRHILLPAIALGTIPLAIIARMTRSSLLGVLRQEYITVARAKGLGSLAVLFRHGLRNALIPIITVGALQFGYLLGGAVITERIFAWPGIGSWLLNAVYARDFDAVQGGALVAAALFAIANLIADVLYGVVNPRIRVGSGK